MAIKVQDCHALTNYFSTQWSQKYGSAPVLNRYKCRYGFENILMDMDMDEAKSLIDFYFKTVSDSRHSVEKFFLNYDKIYRTKEDYDKEAELRTKQRLETQERTARWRELRSKREGTD